MKEYIPVTAIQEALHNGPQNVPDALQRIRDAAAAPSLTLVPCQDCLNYVVFEEGASLGRCKKLGFWFGPNFTCYCCEPKDKKLAAAMRRAKLANASNG